MNAALPFNTIRFMLAIFVYLVMLTPVVLVVWAAFFDSNFMSFPPPGYTLRWFEKAATHDAFSSGFKTSITMALCATFISVALGAAASLVIVRSSLRGMKALQGFLLMPTIVPNIVLGIALYIFFIAIADKLGIDLTQSVAGLIFAHILLTIPWSVRLICANLVGMNMQIEEAAANLGAAPFTVFWRVTLPIMRSGVIAAALFSFIISFENLEISLLLVQPGSTTFPIALMQYLEFQMDPTVAAATAMQVGIVAVVLLITDRFVKLSRVV
jgi:putative spermidine/putrescine transport system permease protein